MSRKIVCFLLVSFIALAAVNFAAAEEKVVVAAPVASCDCAVPVVYAPAPVVYAPAPYWRPLLHHHLYAAPVCAPVCDPCYTPVVYRRGLFGHYRPFYAW